jgi:hypothetical protein
MMGRMDIDWMFSPYHPQSVTKSIPVAGEKWGIGEMERGLEKSEVRTLAMNK